MAGGNTSYNRNEFDSQVLIQVRGSHRCGTLPSHDIFFILDYKAKSSNILDLILELTEIQVLNIWIHSLSPANNRLIKAKSRLRVSIIISLLELSLLAHIVSCTRLIR